MQPSERSKDSIQADKIRAEILRRELGRRRIREFTELTYPNYLNSKHQDYLNEKLEQVERFIASEGKTGIGRLIVTMPPRHGKSEKVSVRFPAWFLGRNPDKRVIISSYGAELAEEWSQKVRNLIESDEYAAIFGKTSALEDAIEVDPEARKIQSWNIKGRNGGLVASGVGGAITGRGAHLFIIDDPLKDREEADSETIRKKIQDWYTSVVRTRIQKGGAIVVMCTRWHQDDLIGWLLDNQPEKWTVVNFPAVAEEADALGRVPGDPLWPEMFDHESLEDIKHDVGPRDWISLYQQQPTAGSGEIFNKDWFQYGSFPRKEDISKCFQVWDTSFTEKTENDYSACATFLVTRDGLFLADIYKAHLGLPKLKEMMKIKYLQWSEVFRVSRIYVENTGAGISVMQSLKKETHLPLVALDVMRTEYGKDKVGRAQAAAGYVEAGQIVFKDGAPWLTDFEMSLLSFPRGKHDDDVDAFVYGVILQQGGGKAPKRFMKDLAKRLERRGLDRHSELLGKW